MHVSFALVSLLSAVSFLSSSASASSARRLSSKHRRAVDVTPTAPGPGDVFRQGSQCTIQWTPGTGSNWKSMTISLMTGSNQAMQVLTTAATGIDGTSLSSYSWPCPNVSPNSAIYFYQFTDSHSANPTWTTRFTIASSNGASTPPTQTEMANGAQVRWGTGKILSAGSASSSSNSNSTTSGTASTGSTTGTSTSSNDTSSSAVAASTPSSTQSSTTSSSSTPSTQNTTTSASNATSSNMSSTQSRTSGAQGQAVVIRGACLTVVSLAAASLLL